MIKVFNSTEEFGNYTQGGMVAGDLYYILSDGSVHFRTNNIDGEDKVYEKSDGSNLTTLEVTENGTYDTTGTDYDGYSEVTVNVAAQESEWITVSTNAEGEYRLSTETGKVYEFLFPSDQDFQIPGFINDSDDFKITTTNDTMGWTNKFVINKYEGYKVIISNSFGTQASFQYRKLN